MEAVDYFAIVGILVSSVLATLILTSVKTENFRHLPMIITHPITMIVGIPAAFMPIAFTAYLLDHHGVNWIVIPILLSVIGIGLTRLVMLKFLFK